MPKNVFDQSLKTKSRVFKIMGRFTRSWLLKANNLTISGSKVLTTIPDKNVLFVVNHQTIFTDVIAMYHAIFSTLNGQVDSIKKSSYLRKPKLNLYFVAARETMEKGFLPKIFAMAGAVSVDRSWRKGDEMVQREVNLDDTKTIGLAIEDGWVVTFPQGTTKVGAPVRKGTAHIIKQYQPIVVPVRGRWVQKSIQQNRTEKD
jgi:1-acyl-sn-glycerol-3-phosphate acyltransferase